MPAPVNDAFAGRIPLLFSDGSISVGPVSNAGATKEAEYEDYQFGPGFSSNFFRSMWWSYRPESSGFASVTLPTGQNMRCVVLQNFSGVDNEYNYSTTNYTYDGGEVGFYADQTAAYCFLIAAPADADMDYSFTVTGPPGGLPPVPTLELQGALRRKIASFEIYGEEPPEPGHLLVLTPVLEQAPATVSVAMASLQPLQEVVFTIDGIEVGREIADVNGDLDVVDLPVDERFLSGPHDVVATTSTEELAGTFLMDLDPPSYPQDYDSDVDPEIPDDGVNKWVLQDPGGLGTWVMPINPTTMGAPHVRKTVAATSTTPAFGRAHVSEGATPVEWEFAGYCPDQEFADKLNAFFELPRRFYLIDHRGRAWTVAFQSVDLKPRKRTKDDYGVDHDDRADYTVRAVLFSQTPKEPA